MKEKFLYPTAIQSITSIRNDLSAFADAGNIPAPELKQITMIVEELFSKIIQFAFEDDGDRLLEISLSKTDTEIMIVLSDDGYPFNPLEYNPLHESDPVSTDEGGMGLSLIKAFSDSILYSREEQRNILHIQKIIRSLPETKKT